MKDGWSRATYTSAGGNRITCPQEVVPCHPGCILQNREGYWYRTFHYNTDYHWRNPTLHFGHILISRPQSESRCLWRNRTNWYWVHDHHSYCWMQGQPKGCHAYLILRVCTTHNTVVIGGKVLIQATMPRQSTMEPPLANTLLTYLYKTQTFSHLFHLSFNLDVSISSNTLLIASSPNSSIWSVNQSAAMICAS